MFKSLRGRSSVLVVILRSAGSGGNALAIVTGISGCFFAALAFLCRW